MTNINITGHNHVWLVTEFVEEDEEYFDSYDDVYTLTTKQIAFIRKAFNDFGRARSLLRRLGVDEIKEDVRVR